MTRKIAHLNSAQDLLDFTSRQGEVLDAALGLLVTGGESLTMAAVTKAASCSKETLYNWFGDRDGLLVAIVQWQAAKVTMPRVDLERLTRAGLLNSLTQFGASLLGVLTSDISVALNRVAIARAGLDGTNLGDIVLQNGRFSMGKQLKPLLEAGREAGLLEFEESEEAFASFFGLLIRDVQVRLLLGDEMSLGPKKINKHAENTADQFMRLFSA